MYLKSLTMRGFKSFANKTVLDFEPGTTVIVGPNGTGKSNIVDAFMWVSGEQNPRTLRSSKMQDVIFSGSNVKPASGTAEVLLCFDNTDGVFPIDFSEVTISRRIYRSGESDYSINGSTCRLTDIRELLINTGVAKEMYSVVGQGRLDAILNSRPEERRYLIEEAAGLGKFKRRKEKALRKLNATERNLVRVKDIMVEIRRQLKPLRDQARVSRQHKQFVNQLRELEVQYILAELDDLETRVKEYSKRGKSNQKEIESIRKTIKKGRKEQGDYEKKLDESRERLESCTDKMQILLTCREKTQGLSTLVREKQVNLERRSERVTDELADLRNDLNGVVEEITLLTSQSAKLAKQRQKLVEKLEDPDKKDDLNTLLSKLKEELAQVQAKIRSEESLNELFGGISKKTEEKTKLDGVAGMLGDLIAVDKEHEKAIEAFLGQRLFYNVAKNEKSARKILKDAKRSDWPSLVLSGFTSRKIEMVKPPKNCRALIDLVKSDVLDKTLLERLFANVFVAYSATEAFECMTKMADYDVTFIAPDGEVITPYMVTGSSKEREARLIGRKRRLKDYREKENGLLKSIRAYEHEYEQQNSKMEELNAAINEAERKLTETNLKLDSTKDKEGYLNERIDKLPGQDQHAEEKTGESAEDFEVMLHRTEDLQGLLRRLTVIIEKALVSTEDKAQAEKSSEEKIRFNLGSRRNQLGELEKTLAAFERETHLEDVSKAQLEPKIKTLTDQLKGDFELSIDEAKKKYEVRRLGHDLIVDMREIRNRIEQLGPVNPIASEEYDEVERRKEHLDEQMKDLGKSERSLRKVIAIMDQKMADRFMQVFEETNEAFKELFIYMFTDGKASLKLTNPDDPLTTGIEIEAQPGGRRSKKLSLLSGGESAMTAIALIFALFKTNPAPFYILDEVDVALDDINLQRLVSLLDMFNDKAQFLVVTHQRRTMETANILYGVSMEKDGSSKLISQRFNEKKKKHEKKQKSLASRN